MIFAALVYFLSTAIGLTDMWLHIVSTSAVTIRPVEMQDTDALYGLAFDQDRCGPLDQSVYPCPKLVNDTGPFGIQWGAGDLNLLSEAFGTLSNISPWVDILWITTNGQGFSAMIPGSIYDRSKSFTMSTFAAKAKCMPLIDRCEKDGAGAVVNCTSGGYPRIPYYTNASNGSQIIRSTVFGIIDGEMGGMRYVVLSPPKPFISL